MKLSTGLAALFVATFSMAAFAADPAPAPAAPAATQPSYPPELDTTAKRASYGLGLQIGENLKSFPAALDYEVLMRAMRDSLANKPLLTREQVENALNEFGKEIMATRKTEGEAFLVKNKTADGVKTTASGLQYKVVEEGKGKTPGATDWVTVHYTGMLTNESVFDSSKGNKPVKFPVNGVIAGWTEGLQLMKEGAKYRFFIPSKLGYGENGNAKIPPHSVLIFDVELISVDPPPANQMDQ